MIFKIKILKTLRQILIVIALSSVHQSTFAEQSVTTNTMIRGSESNTIDKITQSEDSQEKSYLLNEQAIKEKASFWGLTVEEWHKFEAIKEKGGRGYWSPNLDPLTTLGVEAKTKEEREHYAKLLVKKEFDRTTKELEFQRTYDKMFKNLYPDMLPIELDNNPNFVVPLNPNGERMVLFVDVNDSVSGANLLQKALKTGKEMDIYLLNSKDDNTLVQKWASNHHISLERVQNGSLTLNHDKGEWRQIGKGILPTLLQEKNGGKWRQIELGD